MLGNVYIQEVYIAGKVFRILSIFCYVQRNPCRIISKQLGRKDFPMEQLPIDSCMLLCKQNNSISNYE